jgi:ribulose-5-phosphate 4-epimerase/fuculose-1-phosphate aldolase
LKNHGPLVLGASIAEAWDDLYYLERAAEVQLKAMASGRPLKAIAHNIASAACRQMLIGNAQSAQLHLDSVKRQLAGTGFDR